MSAQKKYTITLSNAKSNPKLKPKPNVNIVTNTNASTNTSTQSKINIDKTTDINVQKPTDEQIKHAYEKMLGKDSPIDLKSDDAECVENILLLNRHYKNMFDAVTTQSDIMIKDETYSLEKHPHQKNTPTLIHPLIIALFIYEYPMLDERVIFSRISNIVEKIVHGEKFDTKGEQEFYDDIVLNSSKYFDINNLDELNVYDELEANCLFQYEIIKAVYELRNGNYLLKNVPSYDTEIICPYPIPNENYLPPIYPNTYGNSYNTNVRSKTLLDKLFDVFLLKPTTVSFSYLKGIKNNLTHVSSLTSGQSMKKSYLTLKLQLGAPSVDISNALSQPQIFIQDGKTCVRTENVVNTDDILIIYVNRNHAFTNTKKKLGFFQPVLSLNIELMNGGALSHDQLTQQPKPLINFSFDKMLVGKQNFKLKSVINYKKTHKQIITDCALIVHESRDGLMTPFSFCYDRSNIKGNDVTPIIYKTKDEFYDEASKKGIIFIYGKCD